MVFLLPQVMANAAERYPDREAVRFSSSSLTYAELIGKTDSLARGLIEQGVTRGDRVGIFMNKSLESVVAVYGIMKAGAAYVPLDPFAPVARLSYVIRDCGIHCLVTKEAKLDQLRQILEAQAGLECLIGVGPPESLAIRCLSWDEVYASPSGAVPDVGTIEEDLAYILYTSGSTGDPLSLIHI